MIENIRKLFENRRKAYTIEGEICECYFDEWIYKLKSEHGYFTIVLEIPNVLHKEHSLRLYKGARVRVYGKLSDSSIQAEKIDVLDKDGKTIATYTL